MEGSYNDHLVQWPDQFRADQKLKHVKRCIFQMPLDTWTLLAADRPGASTTSLGSLFQCLTTLSVKKCFLMSSVNLLWHSFEPFPCGLSLDTRKKNSAPPSPRPLLRMLWRAMRSPLSLLFSRLNNPKVLSCSSQDFPSSPFTTFVALLWMHPRTFTSFFNGGTQTCTQHPRWGHTNAEYSGMIPSPAWLVGLRLMHPRVQRFAFRAARALCWFLQSLLPTSTPRSLRCWFLRSLLPISTPRALSAGLFSSCSSPSLCLCPALLRGSVQSLTLAYAMECPRVWLPWSCRHMDHDLSIAVSAGFLLHKSYRKGWAWGPLWSPLDVKLTCRQGIYLDLENLLFGSRVLSVFPLL